MPVTRKHVNKCWSPALLRSYHLEMVHAFPKSRTVYSIETGQTIKQDSWSYLTISHWRNIVCQPLPHARCCRLIRMWTAWNAVVPPFLPQRLGKEISWRHNCQELWSMETLNEVSTTIKAIMNYRFRGSGGSSRTRRLRGSFRMRYWNHPQLLDGFVLLLPEVEKRISDKIY